MSEYHLRTAGPIGLIFFLLSSELSGEGLYKKKFRKSQNFRSKIFDDILIKK